MESKKAERRKKKRKENGRWLWKINVL